MQHNHVNVFCAVVAIIGIDRQHKLQLQASNACIFLKAQLHFEIIRPEMGYKVTYTYTHTNNKNKKTTRANIYFIKFNSTLHY